MSNAVQHFDTLRSAHKFIFVVFYRGSWCPFCQAYLRDLQSLTGRVEAAGGQILAVTSQAASELPKMRQISGYAGETIVDPENLLALELKRRNIIDIVISDRGDYPHGMAQPAVLVVGDEADGVLYKWSIVPSTMNFNGATDRPQLAQVWDNVEARLQNKPQVHSKLSTSGLLVGIRQKVFGS